MWFLILIYPAGILCIAFIVLLFRYFYEFLNKPDILDTGNKNFTTKFYFYSFVNFIILIVSILFALESSPLKNKISDYGAPYGGLMLLLVIPVCLVISHFLKTNNNHKNFNKFLALSKFLWFLSLIPGVLVALFYGLMMFSGR